MKTKITILLIILLAAGIPILLLQTQTAIQAQQAAEEFQNTEYLQVERGTVSDFVEGLGLVEASAVASLSFSVGGTVAELYVEEGDYVAEGSVLAVLNNETEIISYEQAILALNRAQANQYDLQTVDEDEIALAEASLDAAWASYGVTANQLTAEDRAAMNEDYQAAIANAEQLALDASTAPGGFGGAAYNLLTASAGEAAFRAELTRLQNEQLMAQIRSSSNSAYGQVLRAQAELDRVLAGASPQQLEQAAINLQIAEQQVADFQQDYEDTFLLAPFEGYISDIEIEVGATVSQLAPVIEMTDIDPLVLTVNIDEVDLANVVEGQPVEVRFDALPDVVLEGTLGRISNVGRTIDGIVTYEAMIAVDMFPQGVRVGMTTDVRIITSQAQNVLRVPNGYLREDVDSGRVTVDLVLPDGTLQEREVTLGLRGVQASQITGGLQSGDVIALRIPPSSGPSPQGFGSS